VNPALCHILYPHKSLVFPLQSVKYIYADLIGFLPTLTRTQPHAIRDPITIEAREARIAYWGGETHP
jgi:predicted DNA-binding transcriptional regulator YafY